MLDIAIGGEKFGEFSTTGLLSIVYMVTCKNLVVKILVGLDKSAKIFHHQNFALYGIWLYVYSSDYNVKQVDVLSP